MADVIVAGVPQGAFRRLRSYLKRGNAGVRDGWELDVHRATGKTPGPDIDAIQAVLQSEEGGGTHVLAFGRRETRARTVRALVPFARFRWLNGGLLHYVGASQFEAFIAAINAELAIEETWIDKLRPTHVRDAVLLPQPCFAHNLDSDIWGATETAEDSERIDAIAKQVERFRERYFQDVPGLGRRWVDLEGLVFDHTGEQHGVAEPDRQWKYAYRIPDGFHYDVTDSRGRAFTLTDHAGRRYGREAGKHANVDPYGYVRG